MLSVRGMAHDFGVLRPPGEILFGAGTRHALSQVVARHGDRVFVCADPAVAVGERFTASINALRESTTVVEVFTEFPPELPLKAAQTAITAARRAAPDVVVGFGGGSSLDLAKLVSLGTTTDSSLDTFYGESRVPGPVHPIIAVPTTAGTGSEVTPVAVVADPDRAVKVGISSPYLVPDVAIVDPELTITCPAAVTAAAGIDALTHALESLTARRKTHDFVAPLPAFVGANSLSAPLALHAARAIFANLDTVVRDGAEFAARSEMAYGSMLAGLAFASSGTHLSHAIQYPIGEATHTSHGVGVGLLLPYVLEACLPASEEVLAQVADLVFDSNAPGLGSRSKQAAALIERVAQLRVQIGIPHTLTEIGIKRSDLHAIASQAAAIGRLVGNAPDADSAALIGPILDNALHGRSSIFSSAIASEG